MRKDNERCLDAVNVECGERLFTPRFAAFTISGPSGVGKTEVGEYLAKLYGIPTDHFSGILEGQEPVSQYVRAGVIMRRYIEEEKGIHIVGYIDRSERLDEWLDEQQRILLRQSSVDAPLILEGRLAGILVHELRQSGEMNNKPVVSLLLYANDEERRKRLVPREMKKISRDNLEPKTPEEIWEKTLDREARDLKRWRDLHRVLNEYHPYDGIFYDNIIDTSLTKSSRESAELIHTILLRKGLVAQE